VFNPLRQHRFQRLIRHRSALPSRTQHEHVEKTLNFVPGMFRVVFVGLLESPTTDSHKKSDSKKAPAPRNRGKDQ
jgi:hypothetical protein